MDKRLKKVCEKPKASYSKGGLNMSHLKVRLRRRNLSPQGYREELVQRLCAFIGSPTSRADDVLSRKVKALMMHVSGQITTLAQLCETLENYGWTERGYDAEQITRVYREQFQKTLPVPLTTLVIDDITKVLGVSQWKAYPRFVDYHNRVATNQPLTAPQFDALPENDTRVQDAVRMWKKDFSVFIRALVQLKKNATVQKA